MSYFGNWKKAMETMAREEKAVSVPDGSLKCHLRFIIVENGKTTFY